MHACVKFHIGMVITALAGLFAGMAAAEMKEAWLGSVITISIGIIYGLGLMTAFKIHAKTHHDKENFLK